VARKVKPGDWSRAAESGTQAREPRDLKEARRVFTEDLTRDEQIALAREIAQTRGAELCRAYAGVVLVGYGVRRKRNRRSGAVRVVDEPCVTLVVRKKWPGKKAPNRKSAPLPAYLLAYWPVSGRRKLCAVPTDVDESVDYAGALVQSAAAPINVDQGLGANPQRGMLTCALRRSTYPDLVYVMSCRHVLSRDDRKTSGASVGVGQQARPLGVTRGVMGPLKDKELFSLDAQLAEVTDFSALREALGGHRLARLAEPGTLLPSTCYILTSHGPVKVRESKIVLNMPLEYSGYRFIYHDELVKSEFVSGKTDKGDSGAPVVSNENGGMLLGMHIAGDGSTAYAIPAWDLFTPVLFRGAVSSESWSLLQSEEVAAGGHSNTVAASPPTGGGGAAPLPGWLAPLTVLHNFNGGVKWRLQGDGLSVEGLAPEHTGGLPKTVERVWKDYGEHIRRSASAHDVQVELIIATICTESLGDPESVREEPRYISDEMTPDQVSVGLMHTLISTAAEALGRSTNREELKNPEVSIEAGTVYIARQRNRTGMDPPKVSCAYNAGGIYPNNGTANRWKMKQYPIDSGAHADRFVKWFNDCFRYFAAIGQVPPYSFRALLNSQTEGQ
jgi:hypothetical protein